MRRRDEECRRGENLAIRRGKDETGGVEQKGRQTDKENIRI